jgi:hypothetical protein
VRPASASRKMVRATAITHEPPKTYIKLRLLFCFEFGTQAVAQSRRGTEMGIWEVMVAHGF